MTKTTILIIDQEKMLVDLLVRALSSNTLAVLGTTSVDEAARLLDLHEPDLLVLDPSVPDGFMLLDAVRSEKLKMKIIAITGSAEDRDRVRKMSFQTVERSMGLDGLIAAIRGALGTGVAVMGTDNSVRVLVGEDEEGIREMLSEFLSSRGFTVMFAKNGRETIERVKSDPTIQVVLLDVNMPEMGGIEALSTIMASKPHPDVIMMTAVADREVARQALKMGAFDYILKPFAFPAIEASITACLSHAAYKRKSWWKR